MELKSVDVFITHDPKDSAKVEPWVIALRAGGLGVWYDREPDEGGKVKLVASRALERCRLAVFFLSSFSISSEAAFQEVMLARQMKKPTLVIALDSPDIADGWRSLLKDLPMIDIRQDGRRAAWQAMLQALQERRIKWVDPDDHRPSSRINIRRKRLRVRRWTTAMVIFWVVVLLAYFGFMRPRAPVPQLPVSTNPDMVAIPEPAEEKATGQPANPAGEPSRPPKDEPKLTPSPELALPMDILQSRAVAHVKASIASANRDQGLDAEHIDRVLSFFAEPAWIQDRGKQDKSGLKAYMKVRQIEWPRWLELVESIDVSGADSEGVLVSVRSSYLAENQDHQAPITGVLNTRYTISFSAEGAPAIVRVEGTAEATKPN